MCFECRKIVVHKTKKDEDKVVYKIGKIMPHVDNKIHAPFQKYPYDIGSWDKAKAFTIDKYKSRVNGYIRCSNGFHCIPSKKGAMESLVSINNENGPICNGKNQHYIMKCLIRGRYIIGKSISVGIPEWEDKKCILAEELKIVNVYDIIDGKLVDVTDRFRKEE